MGIDYTSAAYQGAGIGRLTRQVVRALAEIDRENEYRLLIKGRRPPVSSQHTFSGDARNRVSGISQTNFREVRTWLDERWWTRIWHRFRLPIDVEWLIGPVDLFHSPDFTLPPTRTSTRTMVTIHDLSFFHLPHCFEPSLLQYLTTHVPRSIRRADHILADSENTCRDLAKLLNVAAAQVTVLYPGVEPRFRPITDEAALEHIRARYGLSSRFVLSVGTVQPRKNYARLIEAFAELDHPDLSLVIVGAMGWLYEGTVARVHDLGLGDRVRFVGFVDDADLPALYNLAEIFVFPSLYEGFGIPPLEAMACGTPTIVGDNSSLPEVVGSAGLLIDAADTAALASAMRQLLDDQTLRQELVARGLARARSFTWERAARTLFATYLRLGGA